MMVGHRKGFLEDTPFEVGLGSTDKTFLDAGVGHLGSIGVNHVPEP